MLLPLFRPAGSGAASLQRLRDQLAMLEAALETKRQPIRPQDFQVRASNIETIRPWEKAGG
jgi:hypothetical protein